jgi:acetyl esterase/lipase
VIVYGSMDRQTLDAAYNNSAAVADSDRYLADWLRRSEAFRARMPDHLDLVYGDAPRARLDFFATRRGGAPTLLFFHGGYWQRNAKEGFAFVAEGPLAHGFNVVVAGYTLAPEAGMDGIVREARTALRWLHRHLATLGGDPARLYVGGWSAGGHLAAMLMDESLVAGGLAISGLFDLEPIRLSYLNEKLGLDAEQARRNSPLRNLPARAAKFMIAYGSDELPELKRQSREFGAAWTARGLPVEMIEVVDCHHYAILEQFAQSDGFLAKALAASAGADPG